VSARAPEQTELEPAVPLTLTVPNRFAMPLTLGVLEIRARGVERAQHSIAKVHRVAKVLEANRVLVEPRDRKPRDDAPSATTRFSYPTASSPASVRTVTTRSSSSRATALPSTRSACGHSMRRGRRRGAASSRRPPPREEAACRACWSPGVTIVAPLLPRQRATCAPPNPPPRINVPLRSALTAAGRRGWTRARGLRRRCGTGWRRPGAGLHQSAGSAARCSSRSTASGRRGG